MMVPTELAPEVAAPGRGAGAPIRVILADDHALMRRSLRFLLNAADGLEVVAEAGDLSTVVRQVHDYGPDVLVIDLSMSNGSSIEKVRHLRAEVPGTEIVVLTMEESRVFAQEALDAGAVGFVLRHAAEAELSQAVRRAAGGERYLSPRLAARLALLRRSSAADGLSLGETEVLRLVALGRTSAEIGLELHLPALTVQRDCARIHRELGLATRDELVAHALGRGLLDT